VNLHIKIVHGIIIGCLFICAFMCGSSRSSYFSSCPIHGVNFICGPVEFVCKSCTDDGWYSTAGWGGPTKHINRKTGEIRRPGTTADESAYEQTTNDNTMDNLDM